MKTLAKVMGFSLTLALFFTVVANLLPQVTGEAPKATKIDVGAITMDQYVALGDSIFHGKGTCTLCHNERGRAPNIPILNMADEVKKALADPRYKGKATDMGSYLHESEYDPSAYVVPGFGKKGTNDTVSPMPATNKPPIGLSDLEENAVIAWLEAKDGNEISVSLPAAGATPPPAAGGEDETVKVAATPQEAINKFGCNTCHNLLGSGADIGPDLTKLGPTLSEAFIRESIMEPNADITEGFDADIMPDDFAEQMTAKELYMLAKFVHEGAGADSKEGK